MAAKRSSWMDDDLDAVRDLARAFCEKEVAPHSDRFIEQHHVDRDLWTQAGQLGLLCMSIPEQYGGGGGTFAHEAVMIEEQARIGDSAWGAPLHSGIVAHYLLEYGTEAQKEQFLPRLATGEMVGAIAMTEPGTGSDLQSVTTKAVRVGDEYVVNGSKTFITNGAQADLTIVVVKTDPTAGANGISLVLVEGDRPGFRRGRVLDKVGQRGQDTSELYFEDVHIPVSNLLGTTEGQGFIQLMQQLPQERLLVGSQAISMAERALAVTIDYVKDRKAFGKAIIDFQNTQFKLAEVKTEVTVGRVFYNDCVARHLTGGLDPVTASMCKYWLTDLQCKVVDECLQLFGGYRYMNEYPIARMFRDARVQRIYGGTNEIMKVLISRSL